MPIRKAWVAMALGVGLFMAGGRLAALGLGVVEVRSGLGQPLVVVLPLIRSAAERFDPQEITVSPAGRETYARAGLDYPRVLHDLRGGVEQSRGGPVLRLSTKRPVFEPLLNLLVELRWPRGRLIRSVTVLLDPVQGLGRAPVVRRKPLPRPATPTAPSSAAPGPARNYGPVAPGETLSGIAARLRTDPGVSLRKWMQALYRRNPQAFGASMDVLKQGAVLELPSPQEVARTETPPAARATLAKAPEPQPPAREGVPQPTPPESGQTQRFYILAGGEEGRVDGGSAAARGEAGFAPARPGSAPRAADEETAVEQPLPQRLHQARLELKGLHQDNQLLRESVARLEQQILGSRARLERLLTEYRRLRDVLQAFKSATRDTAAQEALAQAGGAWVPTTAFLGLAALILGFALIRRQRHSRPPAPVPEAGAAAETGTLEGGFGGTAQARRTPLECSPVREAMQTPEPAKATAGGSFVGSDQIVSEYLSTGELDLTDSRVHEEIINAPGHQEVKLLLLTFYRELGRYEELQALASRILARHPDVSEAFRRQLRAIVGAGADTSPGLTGEADTEIMEAGHLASGVPEVGLLDEETGQTREMPAKGPDPKPGQPWIKRSS